MYLYGQDPRLGPYRVAMIKTDAILDRRVKWIIGLSCERVTILVWFRDFCETCAESSLHTERTDTRSRVIAYGSARDWPRGSVLLTKIFKLFQGKVGIVVLRSCNIVTALFFGSIPVMKCN